MPEELTPERGEELIAGKVNFESLKAEIDAYLESKLPSIVKTAGEKYIASLGITEPVKSLMDRAMERSGNSAEGVLVKSLSMFILALEAENEGQRVAILEADDTIVDFITDIGAADETILHALR